MGNIYQWKQFQEQVSLEMKNRDQYNPFRQGEPCKKQRSKINRNRKYNIRLGERRGAE